MIQNLGTTLLGIGKANSIIVGSYGALFTGLNGIENNFSQSFLLAPNANKVKEHIFTALDDQAQRLRQAPDSKKNSSSADKGTKISLRPESFTEAYMALERYADICTQQTAKEIVNSALDQTKTEVMTDQGNKISTTSTKISADAAVTKLSSDVLSLQKDTTKAITKLQNAVDSAVINNDKKISSQLGEIEKK